MTLEKEPGQTWEEEYEKHMAHLNWKGCICCQRAMRFKENFKQELTTTRLSAAAEERKRVCEEMSREVASLKKDEHVQKMDEFTAKINWANPMYNLALSDVLSLIEKIKNSV